MSSKANRGRAFEEIIIQALALEENKGRSLVFKMPTAWKVIRGFNRATGRSEIVTAYPEHKSSVDFLGLHMGRALAFEAKSIENKNRFPLANIEPHQLAFLEKWRALGGFSFVLVEFSKLHRVFFITWEQLRDYIKTSKKRSIALAWFEQNTYEIKQPLYFLRELEQENIL